MRSFPELILLALVGLPVAAPARAQEVPPEIPAATYMARRAQLMKKLDGCVAVIKNHGERGTPEPYFFYLTGLDDPGAVLLLAPKEPIYKTRLSLQPRDPEAEIWEGYREKMSYDLRKKYGVDDVRRMRGDTPRGFDDALRRAQCYATLRPAYSSYHDIDSDTLQKHLAAFEARTVQKWQDLERMRARHDDEEVARLEKAIAITAHGHEAAIRSAKPGVVEKEIQGRIESAFYENGGTGLAFESIVGSGEDGAVLHWIDNDRKLGKDDLVLVDIGAAYGGYAADVTRTFPVSGKFTTRQREVYDVVASVQQRVIDAVRPGISLEQLHKIAEDALHDAGYDFPHGIGHFVGLEVHDVGARSMPLEAGMVITVEPGIYIQGELGVRIEDMVLVTRKGHRLMTSDLPRKSADVEAWVARVRKKGPAR